MSEPSKPSVSRRPDRLVLLGAAHGVVIDDMKEISLGSTFLYEKDRQLQNILLEAFAEMNFVVQQFQRNHENLLANSTPEVDDYIKQLNETSVAASLNFIVELHAVDLSTYFKAFLVLAKVALDKVIPLFSYSFYDTLDTFSDRGKRLIRRVNDNKNVGKKAEFIALIERAKSTWLDALIDLRDEYTHYSNLREYVNFWVPGEWIGRRKFNSIRDFHRPTVSIQNKQVDALEYMLSIKAELIRFLREFLVLCEFTPDKRPKHYLSCEECKYVFAKRLKSGDKRGKIIPTSQFAVEIKDRAKDYGVIICPQCGEKTDTDLQLWTEG